ncbi:hypothetical protein [Bradymonas sediminis]|uniref:hypothetical protein n=1 Tax=Bradymonas sediminis TaxID=1548548 RepID=UPI0010DE612E|nr:hypothetical protein [Bradymonas sediminis]TDP62411.1 hypothetical protein DFR33_11374 [Bradymonas sediminis]
MPKNLESLSRVDGFIAASFVELFTGITVDAIQGDPAFDVEVAGAINTSVVQAKLSALEALKLEDEIEEILVSLGTQYHLMRMLPGRSGVFLYLVVDRAVANLSLARIAMAGVGAELEPKAAATTATPAATPLRAAPSYPRAYLKQGDDTTKHRKKPEDSTSRAFPRGV